MVRGFWKCGKEKIYAWILWITCALSIKTRRSGFSPIVLRKQNGLTFGELWTTTCFTQTHFLTFNLTRVTSNEASFTQFRTQGFVVLHQSAGDTVTDRTCLTGDTTTFNGDVQIQFSTISTSSSGWRTTMRAVSRPKYCSRERWLITILPLPGLMKTRAAELCGDQCRSIDFQPLPIIPIRCQELAVAVPRGCARCLRKLSVYGT